MIESHLLKNLSGYIGGKWVDADSGDTLAVMNPANGKELAQVPVMGADETQRAIDAGKKALAQGSSIEERKEWLSDIHDALMSEKSEIGRILCLEHGKPWKEAEGEAAYAAGFFADAAKHIDKLAPHKLDEKPKDCSWTVHHRPIGVVALITPWNFPIGMIAKKLAPALAAGCPVVIKPASLTPLTMISLFSLLHGLDLPEGMVNLVMGKSGPIGDTLCQSPDVPMLSFTGSTEVGKHLIDNTKDHVKKLALELGGNAPFIVFEDADLDLAADNLIGNKFRGGGQTCVCANRVYVHEKIAEQFTGKVVERVRKMTVGDGMDEKIDMGPLIDEAGFNKVLDHLSDALKHGATLAAGKQPDELSTDNGLFFPPTVVTGVTHDMKCCKEETFGPLVPIIEFASDEQAVEFGNNTVFGLAAYVFTQDDDRANKIISALHFGHVGYNTGTGPTPEVPFGGMLQSGIGREGGAEALFEFVEIQSVPRGG